MSENTLSATKSSKGLMNAVLIPLLYTIGDIGGYAEKYTSNSRSLFV